LNIINSVEEQEKLCKRLTDDNIKISLIPTMGNLHLGHESLFKASVNDDYRIVSLFINPLQFNDYKDYENYPKTIEKDLKVLKSHNIDCLFMPNEEDIILKTNHNIERKLPNFANILCGKFRKSHFQGVYSIVKKLFNIIKPQKAYFGKKDFQQLLLIKYLVKECFKNTIDIIECETIREKSGLAMSSRNNKLSVKQNRLAALVFNELVSLRKYLKNNNIDLFPMLREEIIKKLSKQDIKIEYLDILCRNNLNTPTEQDIDINIFVAFYIGDVRLIDNIEI
jgi:pantoate--beta-alanine ligase